MQCIQAYTGDWNLYYIHPFKTQVRPEDNNFYVAIVDISMIDLLLFTAQKLFYVFSVLSGRFSSLSVYPH